MIVLISHSLALSSMCAAVTVCMALYTLKKKFITFFRLSFSEPVFMRLILYMSADHFVLQCFDTVSCAIQPVKIVPKKLVSTCHR